MKNLAFIQKNFFDSLVFAQEVAKKFNTKLATFHDLINLRVNQNHDNSFVWNRWFTPFATLYLGRHNGRRLIVVAQHLGPLNNKERFLQWAESGKKDEDSDRRQYGSAGLPKISQQEFVDLIESKFGEVSILDFDEYYAKYGVNIQSSFIHFANAWDDSLLKLLFGAKCNDFLEKHLQISSDNAKEKNKKEGAGNKILELGIRDRYGWYLFDSHKVDFPDDEPIALFLTLGRLTSYSNNDLSLGTEIRTHEDSGHANFVVLNDENEDVIGIDYTHEKHWQDCLVENEEKIPDFFVLMSIGDKLFTQYPKDGARMDSGEPMFEIMECEKVGESTFFKTEIYGSPFLKYDIQEAIAVAPKGANAYIINGEIAGRKTATVPVQFFKVQINSRKRILRDIEVAGDLDLLLKINGVKID
jgi:hypothetical protein